MKSKILLIGLVALLLLGGVGVFLYTRQSPKGDTVAKEITGSKSNKEAYVDTLKNLADLGIPLKCTYEIAGTKFEGLLKGEKFKGTVQNPEGGTSTVLMIDNCMYSWSEASVQGIKTCYESTEETVWDQAGDTLPESYRCNPAVVADSEFDVPADIEFLDPEGMLEEMMNQVPITE